MFPGPPSSLLTGNIDEMIKAGGFSEELFFNLHGKYGDIVRFFIFPTMLNLSIADPDVVAELYKKGRDRPLETYMFLWYLGKENLLFQHGPIVKQMRLIYGKMIVERSQLDKVHETTIHEFRTKLERWATRPDAKQPVALDMFAELGPAIYDIMGQVMFNGPWLATERGQRVYKLHKYLIENVNRWLLWAGMPVGPIFHPAYVEYLLTMREWRSMVGGLLDERAKAMREDPAKYADDQTAMTTILRAKTEDGRPFFSRERAISTMCGFLNGAYDTTHATSFWLLFNLAKNPEYQTKLLDEFRRVNLPAEPSVDELRNCELLHAVIMESMRMRSTVPVNQRLCLDEDMELGGYVVPKGTNVNIPNGVIAKDPRWFGADPEKFRPERFLGDSPDAERARKSWMMFGAHTRQCIGLIFALAELKSMLHTVLTRITVELEDPNEDGAFKIEAGVNQPLRHFKFILRLRDPRKVDEENNLRWWMSQVSQLEQFQPPAAAGNVARQA